MDKREFRTNEVLVYQRTSFVAKPRHITLTARWTRTVVHPSRQACVSWSCSSVTLVCRVCVQIRGHHIAKLDPLGINSADLDERHPPELLYGHYSFGKAPYLPSSIYLCAGVSCGEVDENFTVSCVVAVISQ